MACDETGFRGLVPARNSNIPQQLRLSIHVVILTHCPRLDLKKIYAMEWLSNHWYQGSVCRSNTTQHTNA
jgi:hypothetical protein